MNVARNVAEVLSEHTTLELESIDRLYLNAYVPMLQSGAGTAYFFRKIRGNPVPSSALMAPMTRRFVSALERYAQREGVDLTRFERGERKDARTQAYLRHWHGGEGVGSVRNSVSGPFWPDLIGPAISRQCNSSGRPCTPESADADCGSAPNWGRERFPRAVHGRDPHKQYSAGGRAVEIAAPGHDTTTKRSPKRIANSMRACGQNSGAARQPRCTPRSAR